MFTGGELSAWQSTLIFWHWPLWGWVVFPQYRKWLISMNKKVLYNSLIKVQKHECLSLQESLCRCFCPKLFWHCATLKNWKWHCAALKNWKCYFWKHCIVGLWRTRYSGLRGTICASSNTGTLESFVPLSANRGDVSGAFPCPWMTWPSERQTYGRRRLCPCAEALRIITYCLSGKKMQIVAVKARVPN